jgi:hypothetical protein
MTESENQPYTPREGVRFLRGTRCKCAERIQAARATVKKRGSASVRVCAHHFIHPEGIVPRGYTVLTQTCSQYSCLRSSRRTKYCYLTIGRKPVGRAVNRDWVSKFPVKHPLQRKILQVLMERGPMTRSQLVAALDRARTTIYDALVKLSSRMLVTRFARPRARNQGRPPVYFKLVDEEIRKIELKNPR